MDTTTGVTVGEYKCESTFCIFFEPLTGFPVQLQNGMYICMCVCVLCGIHTARTNTNKPTHTTHQRTHTHPPISRTHIRLPPCIRVCTSPYVFTHTHTHTHTHMSIHTYASTHTYTNTHTRTHTHAHTRIQRYM